MLRCLQNIVNSSFKIKFNSRNLKAFADQPFYSIRKVKKKSEEEKKKESKNDDYEIEDVPKGELKAHMKEAKKQDREDEFDFQTMV